MTSAEVGLVFPIAALPSQESKSSRRHPEASRLHERREGSGGECSRFVHEPTGWLLAQDSRPAGENAGLRNDVSKGGPSLHDLAGSVIVLDVDGSWQLPCILAENSSRRRW